MPQLDPSFLMSQLFWLLVIFSLCYLFNKFVFLPKIVKVLEEREKFIRANIDAVESNLLEIKAVELELKEMAEKGTNEVHSIRTESLKKVHDMLHIEMLTLQNVLAEKMVKIDEEMMIKKDDMMKQVKGIVEEAVPKIVESLLVNRGNSAFKRKSKLG